MTPGTALVLLGFGLGALIVVGRSNPRALPLSPREQADTLRKRALEAQRCAARASQLARDLAARWTEAEDAARNGRGGAG
jgi:HD-like signal output (HDOD) protein